MRPGKLAEVAEEVLKYRFEIVALQEIRWQGSGRMDKREYTLLYSGPVTRTGFIISRSMREHLLEFDPVNERICKMRIKGKFRNVSLLSVHAPTEEKSDDEKESFYEDLERECNKIQNYDQLIILGDLNAKIGREEELKTIAGKHTIHQSTSGNGWMLAEFAARNNMVIKSTQFAHRTIHLGTWTSPDASTINQIDHVLTRRGYSSSITDVRSCRGPNCDSDHYMIKVTLRERIQVVRRENTTKRKHWNMEKLKVRENKERFQAILEEKLNNNIEEESIEENWRRILDVLNNAAERSLGVKSRENKKEWFDNDCRRAIEEKNKARKRMIDRRTRTAHEEYRKKRQEADKVCRKKKRLMMKRKLEEIEELNEQSEIKKFYAAVGHMRRGFQPQMRAYKKKDGTVANEEELLTRWVQHFDQVLNDQDINEANPSEIEPIESREREETRRTNTGRGRIGDKEAER